MLIEHRTAWNRHWESVGQTFREAALMAADSETDRSPAQRSGSTERTAGSMPSGICRAQEAIGRLGGLRDLYSDVLGRLLADKTGAYARVRRAVEARDHAEVHAAAHNLKGLAMMCGAISVADVSAALEEAGRAEDAAELSVLLAKLDAEMAAARIILAPYR